MSSLWSEAFAALQSPAITFGGGAIAWSELLGDLTGLWCVWLVARENIWNWPIGILNNAFFLVLFIHSKLYGDALLQGIFAVLGAWGWWQWMAGSAMRRGAIRQTLRVEWFAFLLAMLFLTGAAAQFLRAHTDSPVPLWDGSVLVLSLIATYGQAKKLLESWWLWIAVDVLSVPLYISRGLYPTALLYVLFAALCVIGLRGWTLTMKHQPERMAAT